MILRGTLLGLTILYWLTALLLTHLPKPPAIGPEVGDKFQHFLGYGILAGLLYLTLWLSRPALRWTGLVVMGVVLVYGALDEWTQPLTGRSCDLRDWLANVGGAAAAVGALAVLRGVWDWQRRGRSLAEVVKIG